MRTFARFLDTTTVFFAAVEAYVVGEDMSMRPVARSRFMSRVAAVKQAFKAGWPVAPRSVQGRAH